MYKIAKEFSFSMGHRLSCHEGLCKNFHGHNYKVIVGLASSTLDRNGMVMDFGDLKAICENYFKNFDHAMMINSSDRNNYILLQEKMPFLKVIVVDYEPTAENMAREIYQYISKEVKKYNGNPLVDYVTVYETESSKATYEE